MKRENLHYIAVVVLTSLFVFVLFGGEIKETSTRTGLPSVVEGHEDPNGRYNQELMMLRDPVTQKIPKGIFKSEQQFAKTLPKKNIKTISKKGNSIQTITWTERGPNNIGGRTRALGIDIRTSTSPNITIIAGGVSGGIWKSTDDGSSWTQKTTVGQLHNASCIIQDIRSGHEDTWYVGTGEGIGNSANSNTAWFTGDGIFKSTDNGETWTLLASTSTGNQTFDNNFDFVHSIAIDPTNGDVYACACKDIMKSTDGGNSWTKKADNYYGYGYIPSDIKIASDGAIYIAINNYYSVSSLDHYNWIYRSADGGNTWVDITAGVANFPTKFRRGIIEIASSNENVVYFLLSVVTSTGASINSNQLWKYTYISGDGSGTGGSWENRGGNLPDNPGGDLTGNDPFDTQGGYDLTMEAKPDNENFLIIGGTNLYYSDDAFATSQNYTRIGGYAAWNTYAKYSNHHPDIHACVFRPGSNTVFYSGDDGGIQRTNDVTASTVVWTKLNNVYNVTQFYSVSIDPESGSNIILGGTQDNGSLIVTSSGNTGWAELLSGDGTIVNIPPLTDDRYYPATQNGGLYRVTRSYTNYVNIAPSARTNPLFVNPTVVDKNNSSLMYTAGGSNTSTSYTGIWRNTNAINASVTTGWSFLSCTEIASSGYYPKVSAIGLSQSNSANVLYFGTNKGTVKKVINANATPTVTDITGSSMPSTAYVSSIAVDPTNSDKAFVTFSNYNVQSLWYTSDGGTNWTDVEGNLSGSTGPSIRWVSIFDVGGTTHYFLATSIGVYYTTVLDGSSTVWYQAASTYIGNVVCVMLDWRSTDNTLSVATHGRGIFTTQISSPLPVELSSFTAEVDNGIVILDWQTATEVNNYGFEIERASNPALPTSNLRGQETQNGNSDLEGYQTLGFVEGHGNSNSPKEYSFIDENPPAGKVNYRLKQIDTDGAFEYSAIVEVEISLPDKFELSQNYPNPFNPSTVIEYFLPVRQAVGTRHALSVQLKIYDILGREVAVLVNKKQKSGNYKINFDASKLSSGIYFYRIVTNDFTDVKKMMLLK